MRVRHLIGQIIRGGNRYIPAGVAMATADRSMGLAGQARCRSGERSHLNPLPSYRLVGASRGVAAPVRVDTFSDGRR